jgi:preprotein translocase subunit SecB
VPKPAPDAGREQISDARRAAGRVAAKADLLDIRAVRLDAALVSGNVEPPYDVVVEIDPSYDASPFAEGGWIVVYSLAYQVRVQRDEELTAMANVVYNAAYSCRTEDEPSDAELEAFGDTTVVLALYPYLREFLHSTTARFNLGPLVMPLYREPVRRHRVESSDPTPKAKATVDKQKRKSLSASKQKNKGAARPSKGTGSAKSKAG